MDLVSIKKATDGKHKLQATFKNRETGRTKTTKFLHLCTFIYLFREKTNE
jgi:hypothetical protein